MCDFFVILLYLNVYSLNVYSLNVYSLNVYSSRYSLLLQNQARPFIVSAQHFVLFGLLSSKMQRKSDTVCL